MIATNTFRFKAMLGAFLLACAATQGALAAEVAGVKYADSMKVASKELQLNGAGVRTKFFVKVYTLGLYLEEKQSTIEDIMKAEGPRRIRITPLRDITSEDFGNAFMSGLNNNLDNKDKSKIVGQISKFGEMFASLDALKKGDVLDLDWIPGSGTQVFINGKRVGDVTPDLMFYNSILKIWLGEKPADSSLKPKLLAAKK